MKYNNRSIQNRYMKTLMISEQLTERHLDILKADVVKCDHSHEYERQRQHGGSLIDLREVREIGRGMRELTS